MRIWLRLEQHAEQRLRQVVAEMGGTFVECSAEDGAGFVQLACHVGVLRPLPREEEGDVGLAAGGRGSEVGWRVV